MVKLNLGCGIYYKPGYVNIDKYENSVADKIADINHLPYEDNSIDEIEASHIVEHFDVIYLPFLLAEWFRILKPQGELYIETPHLVNSVKKLILSNYKNQKNTIRFLFGIDIPGNFHKIGFTASFLKKTLRSIGFHKLKKNKSQNFKKERGLRIKAIKPMNLSHLDKKFFITKFRWKINYSVQNLSTLYLEAIESNCIVPLMKILPEKINNFYNRKRILSICSSFALLNPQIAFIFLSLFPEDLIRFDYVKAFDFLQKNEFPSLILEDWMKWKKEPQNFLNTITKFYSHWTKKIEYSMIKNDNFKENFHYLLTLKQNKVDFFSFEAINLLTTKLVNNGIKVFSQKKFKKAKELFKKALKYNPTDILASWNLARIYIHLNHRKWKIKNQYISTIRNVSDRKNKTKLRNELKDYLNQKIILDKLIPIQIRD